MHEITITFCDTILAHSSIAGIGMNLSHEDQERLVLAPAIIWAVVTQAFANLVPVSADTARGWVLTLLRMDYHPA